MKDRESFAHQEEVFAANDSTYIKGVNQIEAYMGSVRFDEGVRVFEEVRNLPIGDTSISRARLYNNAAPCYSSLFQEKTALALLDTAKQVYRKRKALGIKNDAEEELLHNLFLNEGASYYRLGVMLKSAKLTQKGDKYFKIGLAKTDSSLKIRQGINGPSKDLLISDCYGNNSLIYKEQGKYELALKTIRQGDSLLGPPDSINKVKKANFRFNKARVLTEMGKFKEAIDLFEETTDTYRKEGSLEIDLLESYAMTGIAYAGLGDDEKALSYYQKALQAFSLNFNAETQSYWENPDINQVLLRFDLLEVLLFKTKSLWKIARKNNLRDLNKLLPTYELSFELMEKLKSNNYSETVRYFLSAYGAEFTKEYLVLTEKLKLPPQTVFNQVDASRTSSQLKGISLRNIQNANNLSDSVRQKEALLDNQLNSLSLLAFYFNQNAPGNPRAIELTQQVSQLRSEKDALIEQIRMNYPQYYSLRYQSRALDLQYIQEALASDQALLTYFWGDSSLFTLKVTKNSIKRYSQPLGILEAQIDSLHQCIAHEKNNQGSGDTSYIQYAHYLYHQLLAPALEDQQNEIKRITIIPDQAIATIPFPMLIREKLKEEDTPQGLKFIGKEISFSYSFSASLYAYQLKRKSAPHSKSLLAIAPAFPECKEGQSYQRGEYLCMLKYSQVEVAKIQFKGKQVYSDRSTSVDDFLALAPDFALLHLSTHAVANEDFPEEAFIALRNGDVTEKLRMKEIIDARLVSELVVLSACQTAKGKFLSGEGVISLARAFMLSGSQTVVSSIWQVEDKATSELMIALYEGLNQQLPIDKALQQAQRQLIDKERHPFYWAAFMTIGNTQPLELNS